MVGEGTSARSERQKHELRISSHAQHSLQAGCSVSAERNEQLSLVEASPQ